jgi:hypothetical protein
MECGVRLRDLDAKLIWQVPEDGNSFRTDEPACPEVKWAQGVLFLCPLCFKINNGPIGTHSVICWFKGRVSDDLEPGPGRWNPQGTTIDDLTFVPPGAVSVQLLGGCNWHGFIVNGDAT